MPDREKLVTHSRSSESRMVIMLITNGLEVKEGRRLFHGRITGHSRFLATYEASIATAFLGTVPLRMWRRWVRPVRLLG